jgi:chloramphenicol 3-O phosphotransferase
MGHKLIHAMHHTILTLSNQGINVLADHVLIDQQWLKECVSMFHDKPAYLIGIKCPLEVLEQREEARKTERTPGAAVKQFDIVHAHGMYDFEVNTSKQNIEDTAQLIKEFLETKTPPRALAQLFESLKPD